MLEFDETAVIAVEYSLLRPATQVAAKGETALHDDFHGLVSRCIEGDQSAMLELVARFQGQVFGLCYRMLGQRQDAEDMTQETFVRVLKNLHKWDPGRAFEPWLLAIAGNRCRTQLAKRMRKPAPQTLNEPIADQSHEIEAAKTLAEEVALGLSQIRDDYRQAFILFHEHEMSYAEIGETLDCPLGTVKTWVHRARKELIQFLIERGVVQEPRHAAR